MNRQTKIPPPPQDFLIDFRTQLVFEAGALLFVLLAFPEVAADSERLAELHASLCAQAIFARAARDGEWAQGCRLLKPIYFTRSDRVIDQDLRTFQRRLRDRLIAGRIANANIFEAAGLSPKLPAGCEGFSIKQLIKLSLDDMEAFDRREHFDAENAEQRIWRDGLPVAHLSAAAQAFLQLPGMAERRVTHHDVIWDEGAIRWIVGRAAETRALMADQPERFATRRAEVVIRLAEEHQERL